MIMMILQNDASNNIVPSNLDTSILLNHQLTIYPFCIIQEDNWIVNTTEAHNLNF